MVPRGWRRLAASPICGRVLSIAWHGGRSCRINPLAGPAGAVSLRWRSRLPRLLYLVVKSISFIYGPARRRPIQVVYLSVEGRTIAGSEEFPTSGVTTPAVFAADGANSTCAYQTALILDIRFREGHCDFPSCG